MKERRTLKLEEPGWTFFQESCYFSPIPSEFESQVLCLKNEDDNSSKFIGLKSID